MQFDNVKLGNRQGTVACTEADGFHKKVITWRHLLHLLHCMSYALWRSNDEVFRHFRDSLVSANEAGLKSFAEVVSLYMLVLQCTMIQTARLFTKSTTLTVLGRQRVGTMMLDNAKSQLIFFEAVWLLLRAAILFTALTASARLCRSLLNFLM